MVVFVVVIVTITITSWPGRWCPKQTCVVLCYVDFPLFMFIITDANGPGPAWMAASEANGPLPWRFAIHLAYYYYYYYK